MSLCETMYAMPDGLQPIQESPDMSVVGVSECTREDE